jgi:hypothetical protein
MIPLNVDSLEYKNCHRTYFHVATIMKNGKEIARSRNRVGSRSRGAGWNDHTIHAECAVVKRLGDLSQLRGCILIVVRLNKRSQIINSKPCHACEKFLEKCMKQYGLRKVFYSS